LSAAPSAFAQASDAVRTEARERFDRGLRLFNQQDNEGALAEFERAYELMPHPMVLYNMGLVLGAAGRAVKAVEVFDRLLANPTGLDAGRLARSKDERARQAALIGEIAVTTPVDGASIEVDGFDAGKTPLAAPLKVTSGSHVVAVLAPGYAPLRKQITVAGRARVDAPFELVPTDIQPAHIALKSRLLDGEVLVDEHPVGKTPLAASLALSAGNHLIEVRRPGYQAARQTITLGPGSTGEVTLEPVLDPASLEREGGFLALEVSERESTTFVDGEPRGVYTKPLHLPRGPHVLRVERAGFFPFERKVDVRKGGATSVKVELMPTPDERAAYRSRTVTQRTWGFIATGAGAVLTAGGLTYVIINKGQQSDKEDAFNAELTRSSAGGECDPMTQRPADCEESLNIALKDLKDTRSLEKYGWITAGVGAASLATGIVLLLVNDDPNRYEPKPESDVFGSLKLLPEVAPDGRGAAFVLSGTLW
jgi:hypothetical protein